MEVPKVANNMHKVVLIIILIIGILVGVYLVRNQSTTTKTQAASNVISSFEFKDANGNILTCTPNADDIPVCITPTLQITATLKTDPLPSN